MTVAPAAGPLTRTVTVVTPESTLLELTLAGPGSRFAALLIDTAWQVALLLLLVALAAAPWLLGGEGERLRGWAVRYLWPLALVGGGGILWGYHALFETIWRGQTPGKKALRLRVVKEGGYGVGFGEAAIRNLLRLVDLLPVVTPYLLGAMLTGLSRRHQRLGDLVAGTLVIRERATPWLEGLLSADSPPPVPTSVTAAQLAAMTAEDRELVDRFLRRRDGLPWASRQDLAAKIAGSLRARLAAGGEAADEDWLESLQTAWLARGRRW